MNRIRAVWDALTVSWVRTKPLTEAELADIDARVRRTMPPAEYERWAAAQAAANPQETPRTGRLGR